VTPGEPSLGNRRIPHATSGCTSAGSSTRPVRPYLLCQVVRGRRPTFAPSSAYDGVQVSHGDAVAPALILAKCGPSISTLVPCLPSDGSPADPPPRLLLRPLHLPVRDPRAPHFPSHAPFQYHCHCFTPATCLPFADLYGGAACTCLGTRRGVSRCGLWQCFRSRSRSLRLWIVVPVGLFAVYGVVRLWIEAWWGARRTGGESGTSVHFSE